MDGRARAGTPRTCCRIPRRLRRPLPSWLRRDKFHAKHTGSLVVPRTTRTSGPASSTPSREQTSATPILSRSSIARSAVGGGIVTRGGEPTITYLSSPASANPNRRVRETCHREHRCAGGVAFCLFSGDPIGEPPRALKRYASRPESKSREETPVSAL
jgi:hypothetical protein